MAWQAYFGSPYFKIIKFDPKSTRGWLKKIVMFGQDFIPFDHKWMFLSIIKIWKWFWFLWALNIILNNFYLQIKSVGTRRLFKIVKVSSKHFLDLGARVWNFKEVYLAHLLVFLSDSKNILLLKCLLANHFKSFKEFSCGRNLTMKKDYKSSRWTPNFRCVTSNDYNLVNFYHLELTLFPKWS